MGSDRRLGPPVTSRGCSPPRCWRGCRRCWSPAGCCGPAIIRSASGSRSSLIAVGAWLIGSALVRERVLRPLQTIANLLAALREGDYSIRARGASPADGLGPRAARGEHAERHAALAAARRARGDGAAPARDRGDRRRRLRVRRRAAAPPGQPRRRAAPRPARRAPAGTRRRARSGWRPASTARRRAPSRPRFPGAPGDGRCAALLFARTDCPTGCWCCRT